MPYYEQEECRKLKAILPQGATLYKYCLLSRLERQSIAYQIYGKDEVKFAEQEKVIESLPLVRLKMEAFVPGEDDIVVGDMLTCKLRVDYINLKKGE